MDATTSITTGYGYDVAGNLTAVTDGRTNTTIYEYNEWNLQDVVTEPSTAAHPAIGDRQWVTTFDAGGLPVRTDEPGGVIVTRVFDELDRITSETGTGGGAPNATRSFGYDAAGRTISAGYPAGTITFGYDDRDLLTSSSGTPDVTAVFDYDANGRMQYRTDAAGTSTFDWTPRGQLQTVTDPLTASTRTNTFNPAGDLAGVAYSSGATRTLSYDDVGRLTGDVMSDRRERRHCRLQLRLRRQRQHRRPHRNAPREPGRGYEQLRVRPRQQTGLLDEARRCNSRVRVGCGRQPHQQRRCHHELRPTQPDHHLRIIGVHVDRSRNSVVGR